MIVYRAARNALAIALLGLPAAAGAQAFGLNEIGACALARGFAVTGIPCDDGSSIYWNPGAVPSKAGWVVSGGVAIIALKGDFTRDSTFRRYETDAPTEVVPELFATYRKDRFAYGLGVYVPYGLTSQWGDDFPGRFAAKKASLQTVYIQPNVSYQISNDWSLGGGPVIAHSTVELIQALDLSAQSPTPGVTFGQLGIAKYTEFAQATLKGSAMAYGFDIGVHGKFGKDWQTGARLLSQVSFNFDDADATFTQVPTGLILAANNPVGAPAGTPVDALVASQFTTGALVSQKVATKIRHPAQFQIGVGYTGYTNTTLSIDYAYVGWKSFNQLPIEFDGPAPDRVLVEDYNNTSSIRLGAERRFSAATALRVGFSAAASAVPPETVTPLLPEQDRQLFMIGGEVPLYAGVMLDATYSHIFAPGARGRMDERSPGMTSAQALALNNGAYTLSANIWAFTLKYSF